MAAAVAAFAPGINNSPSGVSIHRLPVVSTGSSPCRRVFSVAASPGAVTRMLSEEARGFSSLDSSDDWNRYYNGLY